MLRLDPYSESILFQCDRCRRVGELFTEMVEDEGSFFCWNCLGEIQQAGRRTRKNQKGLEYAAH